MKYFKVNVASATFGDSADCRLYFCELGDDTLNNLVVASMSDEALANILTFRDYSPAVGGPYSGTGYQIISTGQQLVPSWMGEAVYTALERGETPLVYLASGDTTITFESGASYGPGELGILTGDLQLLPVTVDLQNFTQVTSYAVGYTNKNSQAAYCYVINLSGGRYPYVQLTGIKSKTLTSSVYMNNWAQIAANEPIYDDSESEDPFTPGGTTGDDESESEGGDGNFENAEVTVDPPALPSLSAITSGFIAAYMPTFAQLQSLGDYLWSDLFSLDTFKKLFSDPMQAILGLSLVPVTPSTNAGNVVIGNVNTGITMPRVMQQFVTVDCGSVTLPEYWGGYLDYSPYTKVEIYLPYIGVRPLDTDEVMGKTLHVVYHVDVLSGACVCFIQCDNTIRYHYVGQCGASIPITANDWTRVVNGAVSIATALGVGVATLGAGAAAAGGITAASMAGAGALVGGVASQVLASKPRVEHSGSLAGMGGILGVQFPYILIQRPRQAVPNRQNAFTGYPSFIKRTLSTVTGYTQVTGVHLTGLSCTDEEKKEIQSYLEAGVIL